MKLIIGIMPIVLSCVFLLFAVHPKIHAFLDICAYLSLYILGILIAFNIYDVVLHGLVFMTTIHAILLNPLFLITGAYVGVYSLYLLIYKLITNLRKS
ncbi:hypothetical protein COE15_00775 [Bacillus cereus]|uniref:hypothetical protein n=1 Tax=Bacillus sp. AFS023182 TaxID=2033492 RepID=UPI000BF611F0|nr:hypothetical protein [Bacillus sp. AFS023182]PFE03012.1 hypothetical protein CN288_15585 [Bacillus sp. AFS023182]PGY05416.1 hypothetical protein COE15_00775 [Bacillus cereus]